MSKLDYTKIVQKQTQILDTKIIREDVNRRFGAIVFFLSLELGLTFLGKGVFLLELFF